MEGFFVCFLFVCCRGRMEKEWRYFSDPPNFFFLQRDLKVALNLTSQDISAVTFCSDDLPQKDKSFPDALDQNSIRSLEQVWKALKAVDGQSVPMSEDRYEHIVAL